MLELNPEIVCFLIDKSHEFHAKEQAVIPEEPNSPAEDWARQVLADHRAELEAMARLLLEKEKIDAQDIQSVLGPVAPSLKETENASTTRNVA